MMQVIQDVSPQDGGGLARYEAPLRHVAVTPRPPGRLFRRVCVLGTLICGDAVAILLVIAILPYVLALAGLASDTPTANGDGAYSLSGLRFGLAVCLLAPFYGGARQEQLIASLLEIRQVGRACIQGLAATIVVTVSLHDYALTIPVLAFWLVLPASILAVRVCTREMLRSLGLWRIPSIMAGGDSATVDGIVRSRAYDVIGRVNLVDLAAATETDLRRSLDASGADVLLVSLSHADVATRKRIYDRLGHSTVPYAIIPDHDSLPVHGCTVQYFLSNPTIILRYSNNLARPFGRAFKSAFDKVAATVLLLVLLPVFVVVGLLVARDGGPVFFVHRRIGTGGRPFGCKKFRTMVVDGDRVLARALAADPALAAEWATNQKLRRDPRVTAIGRFLRSTSLDELPQLLNVLSGDMSLVGPRPIVEAEIARYGQQIELYYRVKPGITGLWQVSGRSDTSYAQRVLLDVWYVRNWSFFHDVAILLKTVPTLLRRQGAV